MRKVVKNLVVIASLVVSVGISTQMLTPNLQSHKAVASKNIENTVSVCSTDEPAPIPDIIRLIGRY